MCLYVLIKCQRLSPVLIAALGKESVSVLRITAAAAAILSLLTGEQTKESSKLFTKKTIELV